MIHRDRYRLVRPLGQGGMGVVWEAVYRPHGEGAIFALKLVPLPRDPDRDEDVFPREALVSLVHPHIAHVHECFRLNDEVQVLRMDLLHGETLSARLRARGPMSLPEAATIAGQTASALGTAHAHGVIHRDVKPSNLFLERRDDGATWVRVLDFGIARFLDGAAVPTVALTRTARSLGTPGYAAPEQLRNARDATAPADVWSLGVVLFECLFGVLPFPEHTDIELWEASATTPPRLHEAGELPSDVRELVARMLSREPSRRPSLDDVSACLAAHATGDLGAIVAPIPTVRPAAPTNTTSAESATLTTEDEGSATDRPVLRTASDVPSLVREESLPVAARDSAPSPRSGGRLARRVALAVGIAALTGTAALFGASRWRSPVPVRGAGTADTAASSAAVPESATPHPEGQTAPPPVVSATVTPSATVTASAMVRPPTPTRPRPPTTVVLSSSATAAPSVASVTEAPTAVPSAMPAASAQTDTRDDISKRAIDTTKDLNLKPK